MDNYDFTDQPYDADTPRRGISFWDILTIGVLVVTLCMAGYFSLIFVNPHSPINPLAPPAGVMVNGLATATITPIQLEPTWTATPTFAPTASRTLAPTWTPFWTESPASLYTPTNTPLPSKTPKPSFPFTASVTPIDSTIIHPEAGCNWLGVGGQVLDKDNSPINAITVHLSGKLGDQNEDYLTVSGTSPQYGPAGFEFQLGTVPIESKNTLWIQVLDQSGLPLSDKIYFNTYTACDKNLTLIRFKKVK